MPDNGEIIERSINDFQKIQSHMKKSTQTYKNSFISPTDIQY